MRRKILRLVWVSERENICDVSMGVWLDGYDYRLGLREVLSG